MEILLIIGIIVGFTLFELFSGRKEGKVGIFILFLKTKKHAYHIHHWIVSLIILIILLSFSIKIPFLLGFLIGSIIQGWTYKDFYKFLTRKKIV